MRGGQGSVRPGFINPGVWRPWLPSLSHRSPAFPSTQVVPPSIKPGSWPLYSSPTQLLTPVPRPYLAVILSGLEQQGPIRRQPSSGTRGGADWPKLKSPAAAGAVDARWTRWPAEGEDTRAEVAYNDLRRKPDTMADSRDPASDQMKLWKEQRTAQVQPALSESHTPASNGLGVPQRGDVPGLYPWSRTGGGAAFCSRWSYIRREDGGRLWGGGSGPAGFVTSGWCRLVGRGWLARNFALSPAGTEVAVWGRNGGACRKRQRAAASRKEVKGGSGNRLCFDLARTVTTSFHICGLPWD